MHQKLETDNELMHKIIEDAIKNSQIIEMLHIKQSFAKTFNVDNVLNV